ncbi:calpain-12 [Scleropages formosus]|uniref:calpain-12 n=1 Tax=Scleropages formosus TaxID=113540 RepID=UPI0010FA941E|nr:calpain-1 catalytic subunit-like [Scleropages formosus]
MASSALEPGSAANPHKFRNQDYESLRDGCVKSGSLFSDPHFPADQRSIGMAPDADPKNAIRWLRPKEISKDAVFIEGTTGTTDICQGQLGDCWLLAALSSLTLHPTLFAKVVPSDQSLTESYAGIFHFRFWQYGDWVEVVVDDFLPVRNGRLLFSHSRTLNEFWSALVEKAYAKMAGSYSSLKGGNISEGMEDFTGGIARSLKISSRTPLALWKLITASLSRGTLLSCFIQVANVREIGTVTPQGLVKGHAYAITHSDKVYNKSGEVFLLKLRNPWGFVEYCGPWSDKCKNWDEVDSAEKKRLELIKVEDGEFWISTEDFSTLFHTVELCSVNPDSLAVDEEGQYSSPSSWTITSYQGAWVPGCSAGGSSKYERSFWKNPQFRLTISELDDYEDEDEYSADEEDGKTDALTLAPTTKLKDKATAKPKEKVMKCTMVAEVLQKYRRQKDKTNFLQIAFHIYMIPPELAGESKPLGQKFFSSRLPVARSGKYQALRGIRRKVRLNPGTYVVVVSTCQPNQQGDFFLRLFSKTGNTLRDPDFTCTSSFATVVQSNPPAHEDYARVQELFNQEAGADERLDAVELMKLLNTVLEKEYHLPLETCRQLIFAEDTGGRSRLTLPQTVQLLSSLRKLQSIFIKYDEDSSGTMSPFDLSLGLQAAGLECDKPVLQLLWERVGAGLSQLPFHGFISCVVKLRVLFALYESESSEEVKKRGINAWLLKLLAV